MTKELGSGQKQFRSRYVLLALGIVLIAAFWAVSFMREMVYYDTVGITSVWTEHLRIWIPFAVIAVNTVLAVVLLRTERIERLALPLCLLVAAVAACFTALSRHYFNLFGGATINGVISFFPALTGELMAGYTARSLSADRHRKERFLLAFLLSVGVPFLYCVLSDRYSFICCLVAAFALLSIRASRDGTLPVGRKILIAALLMTAAGFVVGAVCDAGLAERLALAFNRGRGDPDSVGFFRVIMDQIYGSAGLTYGADFNVVYTGAGAVPVWKYLLLSEPAFLPVSVLAKYGYAAYAAFSLVAFMPPLLLWRFSRGAATSFARYFAYYVFALFLCKTVLNLISCLLFDFSFPLPMVGSRATVFFDAELFLTAMLLCVKKR